MKSAEKVIAFPGTARRGPHEREFLPAALEIQESPPSPLGRAMSLTIISTLCVGLLLASVGSVDIVASAQGKIVPAGRTKVVQPFETGVVRAIHVTDGQTVRAGEVLIELDPSMGNAEREHMRADYDSARLDAARLKAALGPGDPMAAFQPPGEIDPARLASQRALLAGQIAEHKARLTALDTQIAQKQAEVATTNANISKLKALLPIVEQRTDIRKTLFGKELGSKLTYLETLQSLVEMQSELTVQTSRQKEAVAGLQAVIEARAQTEADWRRGLFAELVEAERKAAGLEQDVVKADQRARLQVLTAPIDGVVQQLAIHTVGGVVTPAQVLMALVPLGDDIEIEAQVSNRDVGFVEPGQEAQIKVDTFNFTRYGLIRGAVQSVSRDAVPTDRRSERPSNGAASDAASSEPKTQDLNYSARIALSQRTMKVDERTVPLVPGMAVTVEIKTGSRTVLSYLLSPLQRYRSETFHER